MCCQYILQTVLINNILIIIKIWSYMDVIQFLIYMRVCSWSSASVGFIYSLTMEKLSVIICHQISASVVPANSKFMFSNSVSIVRPLIHQSFKLLPQWSWGKINLMSCLLSGAIFLLILSKALFSGALIARNTAAKSWCKNWLTEVLITCWYLGFSSGCHLLS